MKADKTLEKGIGKRYNRANKFKISRIKDDFGFHVYILENVAKQEKIHIKRFIFDRFRSALKTLENSWKSGALLPEVKVFYRSNEHFVIAQKLNEKHKYLIQEIDHDEDSDGFLSFDIDAIFALNKLLYHKKLLHPNDLLNRLIEYHKIFRFSFSENTESITSKLAIKTDLLCSLETYRKKNNTVYQEKVVHLGHGSAPPQPADISKAKQQNFFKSRLAEKAVAKPAVVNYEQIFISEKEEEEQKENKTEKANSNRIVLPLHCSDIKSFSTVPFSCEFSTTDFSDFLHFVASDRYGEFLLGFEIIDCLFKYSGKLKTFKFPLYYMKITIRESGKEIIIDPIENGLFYLNHLALANLVERFSKSKSADNLNNFFKTLLAQYMSVDGKQTRIYLSRILPVHEEIFTQVRKILFGTPEEKGKGGILFNLTTIGIDVDLDQVMLYRGTKVQSLMAGSLENDLNQILYLAHEYPDRFYNSNLGNFLSPETYIPKAFTSFARRTWIPNAMPKSLSALMHKLDEHNFLLLEGPPGTGKTHSILNLLIHCVCTGKKLLIVSDQQSAIHALMERLLEMLAAGNSNYDKRVANIVTQGIKIIPEINNDIASWANNLKKMLLTSGEIEQTTSDHPDYEAQMRQIDEEINLLKKELQEKIDQKLSPRNYHETTVRGIDSILSFIRFNGYSRQVHKYQEKTAANRRLTSDFIRLRGELKKLIGLYRFFRFPTKLTEYNEELLITREFINRMLKVKPISQNKFNLLFSSQAKNPVVTYLQREWLKSFPPNKSTFTRIFLSIFAFIKYPLSRRLKLLRKILNNQLALIQEGNPKIIFQLNKIHHYLRSPKDHISCLAYEIFAKNNDMSSSKKKKTESKTAQGIFLEIERKQNERDRIVRKKFLLNLSKIAHESRQASNSGQSDPLTTIAALIDSLSSYDTLEMALPVINDLKEKLLDSFPIWICRKQTVSFLFPCTENIFDLVIVDEATQCRVDDALPLLFRASKLLVVGDDKQTVLAKNSALDDYLFFEFGLDEHLRKTQGQALKGGGSHIFGLIKQIKQASLMLDEHYRCPPEIISYSNRYVYHNDLKMMQWGSQNAVVIDYSEEKAKTNVRKTRGMYKGIETDMADRFLLFVEKTIKNIEAEETIKINMETDVAICYFLLKNEPYIKAKKGEFLRRLGRGNDILDGAGAALQGKERDYIFYLWDINRSNMMAFRQGDEEDKRKGELNVLMSRPRKRAYHYLHQNFSNLKHRSATISDYLWSAYMRQKGVKELKTFVPRSINPTPSFNPWRRYSGQLITKILAENMKVSDLHAHYSVNIGDPDFCVDVILESKTGKNVGIIDLSRFREEKNPAESAVAYYFQIKRATPKIQPWFTFIKDISNFSDREFRVLAKAIEKIK